MLNWNIDGSSTTFVKNDNCVPHRLRDQPKKNKNNLKEYWTQLTIRMRETRRARFPIGFLIFSYPWFSHTYPHSNRICQSTRIRQISGLFVTQDSSGSIGNWACVEVVIWNTIFTVQLTLAYSNLASTRFPVHSVFKNLHYGERIQKVADPYARFTGYVWTIQSQNRREKIAD